MKTLICLLVVLAVVASAGIAGAVEDIRNTKHNLSSTSGNTLRATSGPSGDATALEVCVFCHTPHFASTTAQPLWNRTGGSASFTMYNSTFSSTINMTVATNPQGVSAACLSCHDGATALNSLINEPGSGLDTGTYTFTAPGNLSASTNANIGTDLTNDHPISITYSVAADSAFNAAATVRTTLPLYGASADQVECGTCHNPHEKTNPTFLRISNAGSNLCFTCHIK